MLVVSSDPLMTKECKTRHRADKLIEAYDPSVHSEGWSNEQTMSYIKEHNIVCPNCGKIISLMLDNLN